MHPFLKLDQLASWTTSKPPFPIHKTACNLWHSGTGSTVSGAVRVQIWMFLWHGSARLQICEHTRYLQLTEGLCMMAVQSCWFSELWVGRAKGAFEIWQRELVIYADGNRNKQMSNASKEREQWESRVSWAITLKIKYAQPHAQKSSSCIPQKSPQESIKDLHFKAKSLVNWVQTSISLCFRPSAILSVLCRHLSGNAFWLLLYRKYHWEVSLSSNYLLIFGIVFKFFLMPAFLKHHRHYHSHCMTEKLW